MTDSVALPDRGPRSSSFADRPVGVPTLGMLAFGVGVGVLLCVIAVGRIGALDDSRRDLYENSVVAFSDLDTIQASYEAIRQGYTAYTLADVATRTALKDELAGARAALEEQMDAYAGGTEHADRFSTLTDDVAAYFAISDGQLVAALDAGDTTTAGAVAAGPLVPVQNAVTKDFSGLRTVLRDGADVQARAGADDASAATALLWAMLGLSAGMGVVLALVVVRQIGRTAGPVLRYVGALVSDVETGAAAAPPDESSASTAQMAWSVEVTGPKSAVGCGRAPARELDSAAAARPRDRPGDIGDVIKVVRSIVGQTDLLALNATIEAARAREPGRGVAGVTRAAEAPARKSVPATGDLDRGTAMQGGTTAPVAVVAEQTATTQAPPQPRAAVEDLPCRAGDLRRTVWRFAS